MIFSMDERSGSCRELRKIKNTKSKAYKKRSYSIRNSYSSYSDSYSSLYRNSQWYEIGHTTERKDMNNLDHVGTDNKTNQHNDAI